MATLQAVWNESLYVRASHNLRIMFYAITPAEGLYKHSADVPNMFNLVSISYYVVVFMGIILCESHLWELYYVNRIYGNSNLSSTHGFFLQALPTIYFLFFVEAVVSVWQNRFTKSYAVNDTVSNLMAGLLSLLFKLVYIRETPY